MIPLKPFIEVQNLTQYYGQFAALNDVSFTLQKGDIVGLLGPNGAGKSTLLKILSGLMDATSGSMIIKGENIAHGRRFKHFSVSAMLENNPLPQYLKIGEYLRFRAAIKGVEAKNIRTHTEKMMRFVDIRRKMRHQEIRSLSKGMQQRVGLADVLLGDPEFIILDEPMVGLDPFQIAKFHRLISAQKGKKTFLISSHILSEMEHLCNRFMIMNNGYIVAIGSMAELREQFFKERIFMVVVKCELAVIDRFKQQHTTFKIENTVMESDQQHRLSITLPLQNVDHFWRILLDEPDWHLVSISEKVTTLEEIFIRAATYWDNKHVQWN